MAIPFERQIIPPEHIESRIFVLRGRRVMLDRDLAGLYGVALKRLNEQVKRNFERFPDDFMFRLTLEEGKAVMLSRSQIATLKRGQNIKYRPSKRKKH
jgi:hypothetical protein